MIYDNKCSICNKVKENSIDKHCYNCWLKLLNKWSLKSWGNLENGDFDNE